MARDILVLPMTSMPALMVVSRIASSAQAPARTAGAGGVPGWMRSHIPDADDASARSGPETSIRQDHSESKSSSAPPTWFVRILAALPLATAATGIWSLLVGLAGLIVVSALVTMIIWMLYRRDPASHTATELRRARSQAASGVKRATAEIAGVQKRGAKVERTARRLAAQHSRKRGALQAASDRRLRQAAHPQELIDRQLARLTTRKQHELNRSLTRLQKNYVKSYLSRATISANQIPGVGTQLVANLRAAGSTDCSRLLWHHVLAGQRICDCAFPASIGQAGSRSWHRLGKGESNRAMAAKLGRSAVRRQPSVLPAAEIQVVDLQFAAQERQLQDERTRVTKQIADQVAGIEQELDDALVAMNKEQRTEQMPIEQRRTERAAELGQAHSGRYAAQQELRDRDNRLAAAKRSSFGCFVRTSLRG